MIRSVAWIRMAFVLDIAILLDPIDEVHQILRWPFLAHIPKEIMTLFSYHRPIRQSIRLNATRRPVAAD